ncbi:alpha/beta hydrolase [Ruegeria atlantica]|uniref:Pimelyl-[acyl-carrier protein] methyl ester esterase n=1 Tax=Ruegeria atlantica TaxID=81569 RepID=A0A0P1ENY3_9RHOB|nr:alpha/beta hydrolase [Ruegeria atlantica]CUH42157.1 pimelyl-[acyl-carrier protein] methyl ester esterase [Ruegeria atlantica]
MVPTDHTRANAAPETSHSRFAHVKGALILLVPVLAVIYAGIVGYMYVNQQSLLFKPDGELPAPNSIGLADVETVSLTMSDGVRLTAWSAPPATDDAPTVLFFHGQSGNLGDRADRMREILNSGFGLLAPSYRGYPGSEGEPSEMALISDGIQMYDQLDRQGADVVLHGQSLGTAVATAVAELRPNAQLLVLEAPFTATVDVAAERYPWLPVHALMRDQFATRDLIGNVTVPTLIFHGSKDETVPLHHGEALAAMSGDTAQIYVIPDGTHKDLWSHGLWDQVQQSLPAN